LATREHIFLIFGLFWKWKMNLFLLSYSPRKNARFYHNAHLIKITTEVAQVLCIALQIVLDDEHKQQLETLFQTTLDKKLYMGVATYGEHPVVRWTCASINNMYMVLQYGLALAAEYHFRSDKFASTKRNEKKVHACHPVMLLIKKYLLELDPLLDFHPTPLSTAASSSSKTKTKKKPCLYVTNCRRSAFNGFPYCMSDFPTEWVDVEHPITTFRRYMVWKCILADTTARSRLHNPIWSGRTTPPWWNKTVYVMFSDK